MKIKILVFSIVALLLTSCFTGIPVPDDKKDYIGTWESNEIRLVISADGFVNYEKESGATSVSIKGPISEFKNEDFVVSVLGIDSDFDIEKVPYTNENGEMQMVLEGNVLTKIKGFSKRNDVKEVTKLEVPSIEQLNKLTNITFTEFNSSIESGDFTSFYNYISNLWQKETTAEELKTIFVNLIENKDIVLKSSKGEIIYDKESYINGDNNLILEGHITGEVVVTFNLEFINENGEWKLFGINVNYN